MERRGRKKRGPLFLGQTHGRDFGEGADGVSKKRKGPKKDDYGEGEGVQRGGGLINSKTSYRCNGRAREFFVVGGERKSLIS